MLVVNVEGIVSFVVNKGIVVVANVPCACVFVVVVVAVVVVVTIWVVGVVGLVVVVADCL